MVTLTILVSSNLCELKFTVTYSSAAPAYHTVFIATLTGGVFPSISCAMVCLLIYNFLDTPNARL